MRLGRVIAGSAFALVPSVVFGQAQPTGTLWQNAGGSVLVTECPPGGDHDESCRAVAVKGRDGVVPLGGGYIRVALLWSKKNNHGGPEALILGDYGGSGGNADLFAIGFSPRMSFRKISGERFDTIAVRAGAGPLHLTFPFDIEFFNGAPHAGAIILPLPALWAGDDFAIDFGAMTRRRYSASEMDVRALAMSEELRAWANSRYPTPRLYPPEARDGTPVTAKGLVEMMLSGHADQARDLLDRAWPRQWERGDKPLGGESDFWAVLCRAVIGAPFWKRFGLARLPHAALIEQGAKGKA